MSTTPSLPADVGVTRSVLPHSWGFVLALGIACVVAGLLTLVWSALGLNLCRQPAA